MLRVGAVYAFTAQIYKKDALKKVVRQKFFFYWISWSVSFIFGVVYACLSCYNRNGVIWESRGHDSDKIIYERNRSRPKDKW